MTVANADKPTTGSSQTPEHSDTLNSSSQDSSHSGGDSSSRLNGSRDETSPSSEHSNNQNTFNGKNEENLNSQKPAQSMTDTTQKIAELNQQLDEKEKKYLYLYADFENYKKRAVKERSELVKFASEPLVRELLQTVDNLERAIEHTPPETDAQLTEGLHLVLSQFKSTLQKFGIHSIESIQKLFDPNLHEAVGQLASDLPSGTIVKEETRGYTLHGRLLRPARVIISDGKSSAMG